MLRFKNKNIVEKTFLEWILEKKIINRDELDEFYKNKSMYKVNKLDPSQFKYKMKQIDYDKLKPILIQDNFIFP